MKDDITLDPEKSVNVVEFKNPSSFVSPYGSKYALYVNSFELNPESDYNVTVSYSGAHVAANDLTVTLGVDTAAVRQYNTEQHTAYDVMPASLYTLPASVTIPRGQRTATVPIKVKTGQFDFSKSYVLPLKITSVSPEVPISGNFGTILVSMGVKNKYDGVYRVTGTMVDATNAAFVGLSQAGRTQEQELVTVASNKVVAFDPEYFGSNIVIFWTGTGVSGYGTFSPVFEIDPATGKVLSVVNSYGQNAGANRRSAELDPTGVNMYDAATKTLKVK